MYQYAADNEISGLAAALISLLSLAIYVIAVIGLWKMYTKAGKPGWAAIIPLYNWWVWVKIIGRPTWWFWAMIAAILLSWIPLIGWLLTVLIAILWLIGCLEMARCFGKGVGHGLLLWLFPFILAPLLGFGSARYVGPRRSY